MPNRTTSRPVRTAGGPSVRRTVLPGGLRVISESLPGVRSVAFGVWVGVGSRDERPTQHGSSHFLEHLLFKGTERRDALEISASMDAVGGEMNAFTAKEYTCYYARVLDTDLALAVDVVSDLLTSSLVTPEDVEVERGVILEVMSEAIDEPDEMSPYAPRVLSVKIPVDKIGEVIGPKGKMINQIQADTGADITVEDDGTIYIGAVDGPSAEAALATINMIANPTMPKVGERFLGTVVKTAAFGAFVSLLPGKDGLVHISKLGKGKRIGKVEDVVNVGDKIQVEIQEIDQRGKISLVPVQNDAPAAAEPAAAE